MENAGLPVCNSAVTYIGINFHGIRGLFSFPAILLSSHSHSHSWFSFFLWLWVFCFHRENNFHCCGWYLSYVAVVDLSRNDLTEIPYEVCQCWMLESLNCYHNSIRLLSDAVGQLWNLLLLNMTYDTFINVSVAKCGICCWPQLVHAY